MASSEERQRRESSPGEPPGDEDAGAAAPQAAEGDPDAGPTATAEQVEQDDRRDQAEG